MKTGTLQRLKSQAGPWGTPGRVQIQTFAMRLLELAWEDDKADVSCLAPGPQDAPITYLLKCQWSNSFQRNLYHFVGVVLPGGAIGPVPGGRTDAMIHNGNLAGQTALGMLSQVEGCGLAGTDFVTFRADTPFHAFTKDSPLKAVTVNLPADQQGIASSVTALNAFMDFMAGEDLQLTTSWI